MNDLFVLFGCESAKETISKWYNLMKEVGLETDIKKLGVKDDYLNVIVDKVDTDRLGNNPVIIKKEHIISILKDTI